MKGEALPNEVLNTLFVKRNGIVGNELLLWYNFGAKNVSTAICTNFKCEPSGCGAFPQSILFKFILYGNGLSRTGFKSKINNRTSEKITFEKVGNLICLDSCLTSTSSRCSPEI